MKRSKGNTHNSQRNLHAQHAYTTMRSIYSKYLLPESLSCILLILILLFDGTQWTDSPLSWKSYENNTLTERTFKNTCWIENLTRTILLQKELLRKLFGIPLFSKPILIKRLQSNDDMDKQTTPLSKDINTKIYL